MHKYLHVPFNNIRKKPWKNLTYYLSKALFNFNNILKRVKTSVKTKPSYSMKILNRTSLRVEK